MYDIKIVENLWNVDSRPEQLEVFTHLLWLVFGIENGQFSEYTHVSSFQT